jgi:hypothetical protein
MDCAHFGHPSLDVLKKVCFNKSTELMCDAITRFRSNSIIAKGEYSQAINAGFLVCFNPNRSRPRRPTLGRQRLH